MTISHYHTERTFRRFVLGGALVNAVTTLQLSGTGNVVTLLVLALFGVGVAVVADWSLYTIVDPLIDGLMASPGMGLFVVGVAYVVAWVLMFGCGRVVVRQEVLRPLVFPRPCLGQLLPLVTFAEPIRISKPRMGAHVFKRRQGAYLLYPLTQSLLFYAS